MIFQGIWARIAKKPYIFVIFQGGGGPDPLPPLWIRTCNVNGLCHIVPSLLDDDIFLQISDVSYKVDQ